MLFRILEKTELKKLVETSLPDAEIIGPKKVGVRKDGSPIHHYLPVETFDEIDLDYETTEFSAKTYFLPYKEDLSKFNFEDKDWQQEINYRLKPRAIIGLHACDIAALLKLDKVMARDVYPSPYYISRRKNTFILGIDHEPCSGGFCKSLGTNTVARGFDLFLTDLGNEYFVSVGSDQGFSALQDLKTREVTDADTDAYLKIRGKTADSFELDVKVQDLPSLLDIEFESDVWKKWGSKCLSCGSCAMACPTCYCYGVSENVSMDSTKGAKVKQLYSCNLIDFAEVAGGHNFRPSAETRLKYRFYHQHCGFVEAYDEPKCVGCGRCGRTCPSGINPPAVIEDLHQSEVRHNG